MELLSNLLDNIGGQQAFICGDFNFDLLKYDTSPHVNNYIDLLFSHGFIQTITKPTRCTHNSATLIDHFLTNTLTDNYFSSILTTNISDHFPFITRVKIDKIAKVQKNIMCRDFSNNYVDNFKTALSAENWDTLYGLTDSQEAYNFFAERFFSLYELFFPLKNIKFNKNFHSIEKWFSR